MYLLGFVAWIAVSAWLSWGLAKMLTARSSRTWLKPLLAAILMPMVFLAPVADEIIGQFDYDRLCEEAKEVTIHATRPVGIDLYTPEGKWRGSNTDDDPYALEVVVKRHIRWVREPRAPEEIRGAIRIYKHHSKIVDVTDGSMLAEWNIYSTSGGWLGRYFGGGFIVSAQCLPQKIQNSTLEQTVLPFAGREQGGEE